MDEPQRPHELSEDAWLATPSEVRHFIALLVTKLAAVEARLNQTSQNSSKPPSSDPPSAPPRPAKTPWGKPKTKGAQPGHPGRQRDLIPTSEVSQVVPPRRIDGGSRFVERMLTVSATCQQHERPLFRYLIAAVTAYWANQFAPKLLPAGGSERILKNIVSVINWLYGNQIQERRKNLQNKLFIVLYSKI